MKTFKLFDHVRQKYFTFTGDIVNEIQYKDYKKTHYTAYYRTGIVNLFVRENFGKNLKIYMVNTRNVSKSDLEGTDFEEFIKSETYTIANMFNL